MTTREEARPEILARLAAAANLGHALDEFACAGRYDHRTADDLAAACEDYLKAHAECVRIKETTPHREEP